MFRTLSILYCLLLLSYGVLAQTSLVSFGSSWRYLDNGSNQGTNWRTVAFKDTKWKTANGKFGYGISDASTTISFGSNASKKYITTYFRKSISIPDPAIYSSFTVNIKRDDGAVVYLNGKEVYRSNMPTGSISFSTLAKESADHGAVPQSFSIATTAFSKGVNMLAVEIHQAQANTPDMAFDLELVGNPAPPPVAQYALTVTTAGSGTVSKSPNQASYAAGSTVSLTATPASGYRFDGWSGDATGDSNPLAVTMTGNKAIMATFTVLPDQTPPALLSSNRQNPTTESTSANSLTFRATFSERVTGVDAADFVAFPISGTVSGTVAAVAAIGATGTTYDVSLEPVSGEGSIRLDLMGSGTGIVDTAGNAIPAGFTTGQAYTVIPPDQTPPVVLGISRHQPSTENTEATAVTFRASFSERVTGVDPTDFTAVSDSVSGTLAANAVAAGNDGATYDVTVSSLNGSGTLRLDLNDNGTGIADTAGNAISGGYASGQSYTIAQPAPPLPPGQPKVLYYEGFESGSGFAGMNIQTSTTYGFNVVGNPTYQDLKVGRWELRAGDYPASNGTRAEVLFSENLAQQETWHSFVGYFPSADNLIDTDDEAFNQWHQGSSFGRPMMTFRTENGRFEVLRRSPDGLKTHYYIMGSIIYDQWLLFVIHLKQHLTDGIMQVWINGELKMDYQGPTMFDGPIGRWKMGIYKSSWNNGAKTNSIKRVWYVDEVKVGNAASTYESIKPAAGNNLKQFTSVNTGNLDIKDDDQQLDTEQSDQVEVYPTLAQKGSSITLKANSSIVNEASVTDVTGRLVYTQRFTGLTLIETTNLPSGLYFISLARESHAKKHRFIITD